MFDLESFLNKHSLEYKESGSNFILKECPECANTNWKFGISKNNSHLSHCFVCGVGFNIFQFIMALEDVNYQKAKQIFEGTDIKVIKLNNLEPKTINFGKKNIIAKNMNMEVVEFPQEFKKLIKHIPYTIKRKINLNVIHDFNLHYCESGEWTNRLIIPVYFHGSLVGWQGRDITGKSFLKIKSNKNFKKSHFIMNYDTALERKIGILCEGPFDAMHAQMVSRKISAFAIMGKELSQKQLNLLLKTKLKTIFIGLDPDFPENVLKTAKVLNDFFTVRILNIPQGKDLGELNPNQIKELIKQATLVPTKLQKMMEG